jgi:Fibronectin type III domain
MIAERGLAMVCRRVGRETMARWARLSRVRGGWVTLVVVLGLLAAIGATIYGLGAADHALATSNASMWMWSSVRGEISRVNGETGRIDTRYKVVDAQGHVLQVSQTDRYLVLHDLTSGKVSSLDLASLQLAASSQTTPGLGVTVVLSGDAAFIVDSVQGVVRQLDPLTLAPAGEPLRFPPGISGGRFDGNGILWVLVPTEGTVVAIKPGEQNPSGAPAGARTVATTGPSVVRTVPVGSPGHDLTMSTLDNGVAVLDETADTLTTVHGDERHELPVALSGTGSLPDQSGGSAIPVTVVDDRQVYVVDGTHVGEFTVPGSGGKLRPAVPFAGLFYVADDATGTVYALDQTGALIDTIKIATSGAPLELTVRANHLFINAPDASTARVVDAQHRVKVVDKYANNILGGDPPPPPPPSPSPSSPPRRASPSPTPPPVEPPGPPTKVTAVAGNASAHVSWGPAPANNSPITKYVVEGDGAVHEVGAKQQSIDIGGLTNGQTYTFTVYAVNGKGAGPKRAANPVIPTADVPDPPASVTAKEQKDGSVVVTWPAANGQGHKIVQYSVTPISGGAPAAGLTTSDTTITTRPGDLAYGTQYAFTVTAVNDRGASSAASAPSNTVVPFTLPGAPKQPRAQTVDAKGSLVVGWQPADPNGRPVTKYLVNAGGGNQEVKGTTSVTLTGLPDGATVTVTVRAVNEAGTGPPASAAAKTISAPVLTSGGAGANGYNGISVQFTTNGNGSATTCTISVSGGPSGGIGCTGGQIGGLWPGRTYPFTVTATNHAGSSSFSGSATTATVTGTVVCNNNSYCGHGSSTGGIWIYTTPTQTGQAVGSLFAGASIAPQCWTPDSRGATINAQPYGGHKDNRWLRIPFSGNNYIPYAWVNLDGGAAINNLPQC